MYVHNYLAQKYIHRQRVGYLSDNEAFARNLQQLKVSMYIYSRFMLSVSNKTCTTCMFIGGQ